MRHALAPALLLALLAAPAPLLAEDRDPARALEHYVERAQPAYGWTVKGREQVGGVDVVRLELVSQTWRGREWVHRLNLAVPPAAEGERARPGHALLVITGSGGEGRLEAILAATAMRMGVPVAVLHDVPNQPLFAEADPKGRGLKEDALIAYTFKKFAETGDPDWPALLPMTRAAVAAMDCLGEFSVSEAVRGDGGGWAFGKLERFITTGGSKRGWTTWLSAVVDPRVIAIAPIVFDNLNFREQIALHMDTWGHPSPSIHDYTDAGLMELLESPRGDELLQMVDPYTYRRQLELPKLVMLGTNDTYWPLESIHVYRGTLPGDLYCHYVPNGGHGAGLTVVSALVGFFDHVTDRAPDLPTLSLGVDPRRSVTVRAHNEAAVPLEQQVVSVRVWATAIEGRDFTKANWTSLDTTRDGAAWRASLPERFAAGQGRGAFIGEVELQDGSGGTFLLHTPVQVWELGPSE